MLSARDLKKRYGRVEAVAGISLEVDDGEFVAICGRSGSGKSTLLAMLGGLCRPTEGRVEFDGVEVGPELRGRRIGYLFQFASLLPTLRAIDNVALPALLGGMANLTGVYDRAASLLARVGLADRLEAYPAELSGGEQRRVALARALIHNPPLLLADEPTSDLDEETEADILRLLLEIRDATRKTLIVVTHNPDIAARADRVLRLERGRLTAVSEQTPMPAPLPTASPPTVPTVVPPVPLGAGLGRFLLDAALWVGIVVLAVAGLNHGLARIQQSRLQERKTAHELLEQAALRQLRADVENITLQPDRSYLVAVYLQNVTPQEELFVLAPSVRAFVQVDRDWEESPLAPADDQAGRVVALAGKQVFRFRFTPRPGRFEELLPGYMHVRFSNTMLIRKGRESSAPLFERTDDYYVYLKPADADDEAILRRLKFPGKPPLWIPMPPH